MQKRSVLSTLQELYVAFHEKHQTNTVGRSRFAELHPKHCILASARGTHMVLVCLIHQNIILMIKGAKLTTDFNVKRFFKKWYAQQSETGALTQCANCLGP